MARTRTHTSRTNSNTQAAPLADSRAPVSPEMHPSRGEAKAKFEQILEQTHMPFDTKADNMARELSRDSELLSALNPAEKGRLIQILGSGMTGEADQKAINNILGSANNKAEFFGMVQMAGGPQRLNDTLFNPKQQREFRFMLDKFTYDTGPANSPQRAQAKQAFEAVKDAYARLSDEKKRDRTILVIEGARERCRQERAFKLSKGVDPDTLPPEEEALQKEVAKTFAQNEMKRRDVEEHNRVQQQRERDQAAEAEKKEADEKLFEKQWNTDDRRGARVGMWQDFQDDKKRSANVKRQRTAVNFKREEKQESKKKYGEWDRESWRRDWK